MNNIKAIALSAIITSQFWVWLSNATESKLWETKTAVGSIVDQISKIKENCKLSDIKVTPGKKWEKIVETFSCESWKKWEINTDTVNFSKKVEYRWVNYNCSDYLSTVSEWEKKSKWKWSILVWNDIKFLMDESCKEINEFNK